MKKPVTIVLEHQKLKYCFKQLDLLYLKVVDKPGWKTSAHGRQTSVRRFAGMVWSGGG